MAICLCVYSHALTYNLIFSELPYICLVRPHKKNRDITYQMFTCFFKKCIN